MARLPTGNVRWDVTLTIDPKLKEKIQLRIRQNGQVQGRLLVNLLKSWVEREEERDNA